MSRRTGYVAIGLMAATLLAMEADVIANNIAVTNVVLRKLRTDSGLVDMMFDVSWENSWRTASLESNWDAAWIFVKYRLDGSNWQHAALAANGHYAPPGSVIDTPADGRGVFLYQSAANIGDVNFRGVRLCWDYSGSGLQSNSTVDLSVFAIEMVHIPEGDFHVGDGAVADIEGQFEAGVSGAAFLVTNESYEITLGGGGADSLGNNNASGMAAADDFNDSVSRTLPPDFPKGHAPFYCMKYEIGQGQYAEFLNTLPRAQQTARCTATNLNYYISNAAGGSETVLYRNTVRLTEDPGDPHPRVYSTATRDRASNYISWADGAAFADWAGLRPMTELEFEKACRGTLAAVPGEFAWGSTVIIGATNFNGVDGSGTETALPENANSCSGNAAAIQGPVRSGIFARTGTDREQSGGGYYGAMELSGNVCEWTVSAGNATGRIFTGAHGDGSLAADGSANVAFWPGSNAIGTGLRGGDWIYSTIYLRASDRYRGALVVSSRSAYYGWRCVRSAP